MARNVTHEVIYLIIKNPFFILMVVCSIAFFIGACWYCTRKKRSEEDPEMENFFEQEVCIFGSSYNFDSKKSSINFDTGNSKIENTETIIPISTDHNGNLHTNT